MHWRLCSEVEGDVPPPEGGFAGEPFMEAWVLDADRQEHVMTDSRVKEEVVNTDHGSLDPKAQCLGARC